MLVPTPPGNASAYNYSIVPPVAAIVPQPDPGSQPAALLVLAIASSLLLANVLVIWMLKWAKLKREAKARRPPPQAKLTLADRQLAPNSLVDRIVERALADTSVERAPAGSTTSPAPS